MRRPPVSAISVLAVATVAFVVAVVVVVVLTVRSGDDAPDAAVPEPATEPAATLADLAGADLVVGRGSFCEDVDEASVSAALGASADADAGPDAEVTAEDYDNGDLLPASGTPTPAAGAAPGTAGVAHEYGCSWTGEDGTVARAWVFAPPVASARAKRLAAAATRATGCAAYDSEPFGDPTAAYSCTDPAGPTGPVTAGHVGLFGDAWLSCTVTSTTSDSVSLQARADLWCAAAAQAAHNP